MRRNTEGLRKLTWILFFLLFTLPKNALMYTWRRDIEHAKAFWKGLLWNVTHLNNGKKLRLFA